MSPETHDSRGWLNSSGPWIFAFLVILVYCYFLRYLILHSDPKSVGDDHWVRLIFLFGSLEAIAFAAVGFIFGKEVNRARAVTAEANAKQANEETQQAKQVNKEMLKELYDKLPDAPPEQAGNSRTQSQALEEIRRSIGDFITRT